MIKSHSETTTLKKQNVYQMQVYNRNTVQGHTYSNNYMPKHSEYKKASDESKTAKYLRIYTVCLSYSLSE